MKKNLVLLAVSLVFSVLLLEVGVYSATRYFYLPIKVPSYQSLDGNATAGFWVDINQDFGIWHRPESSYRHKKRCFDIIYYANSYGARDRERSKASEGKERVVVLGDSFVEGYGVESESRLTDLLELHTGLEHLNFGTAGNFGPTQYSLLYKTLARRFEHERVLIGFLPENDFMDDDYEFGHKAYATQYRPYLSGEHPDYQLIYFVEKLEDSGRRSATDVWNVANLIRFYLSEYTYTYNVIQYISGILSYKGESYSGYFDYKPKQLRKAQYSLLQIKREAGGKPVTIVSIPVRADLERYGKEGEAPLSREMAVFSRENGFQFIDLLPLMYKHSKDTRDYYLRCDGHWSPYGHEVAAELLLKNLPYYRKQGVY